MCKAQSVMAIGAKYIAIYGVDRMDDVNRRGSQ